MTNATIKTTDTHCPSCSMMIELSVGEIAGVASVKADHATGTTVVEYDPAATNPDVIAEAIRSAGYGAEVVS